MACKKRRNVMFGDKMYDKLRRIGHDEDRSISELLREAVSDWLNKKGHPLSKGYDPVDDKM